MPHQASAQITPSAVAPMPSGSSTGPQSSVLPESLPSIDTGIEFVAQNITDPVQNNTATNITQLATIPPVIDQPITPTSFTPVSEESDDSSDSSSNDDDDDDNYSSSNDDDDSGDGDSSGDDSSGDDSGDEDGEDGGAFASAGSAFASAG